MGMIAVVYPLPAADPCVVKWVGQQGFLSVNVRTWCEQTYPAGNGVHQIPDTVPLCSKCEAAIKIARLTKAGGG